MSLLFKIISNKNIFNFTINVNKFLGLSGNRYKLIVRLYEFERLLNQSRISIPDTPVRNKSNKTTGTINDPQPISLITYENLLTIDDK